MATIEDLCPSISQMSEAELLTHITDMRNRRRTPIAKPKKGTGKRKKEAAAKKKHTPKQLDAFATATVMSDQMKKKLLAELLKIAK